ncbi:MAG TPA: MBL fold metallo-hydrolase [Pseudonocardia sp.]|jgi:glyoxylase-like metal-dependent hydrolase (beta-lactamase superfamily II)|nr:MBL fold metallo-hydrolase [Pseudonocardia sp.]
MEILQLGEVEIIRVAEVENGPFTAGTELIPDSDLATWQDNRDWLAPDHWDPESNQAQACLQTFVLRSAGRTILVDTGAGNGKQRPHFPVFNELATTFLDQLAEAGVRPEDVDVVVCTHLHIDHVGWNTVRQGPDWVPTFPNADYLFNSADFEFWNPANSFERRGELMNKNVFEDSVAPVHHAGQAVLWQDEHTIDENLTLRAAPGHTPGLGVLELRSGDDRAVFVGDLLHSAVQILRPDWNSCFCEDPAQARASRHRVLSWAAEHNALVVPAHLGGAHAAEITPDGDGFAIKGWAQFH